MAKAEFQLETLTCPTCVKKIENTFSKTDGVGSTKVLFNSSKVKIEFDDSQISSEQVKDTIVKLGFPVLKSKFSKD
ncbi:MAG: heavy-metal-associated domain-containing protein [Syntrophomonas sp.]|nr:heavy-metal-associated domain-containing protein [Syntrophomonas sp.]